MIDFSLLYTIHGIWEVIRINNHPFSEYNYLCRCTQCHFIKLLKKEDLEENKVTKICKHLNSKGEYQNSCNSFWENKRIGHIFNGMIRRCYNPKDKAYRWYGSKGIKICEEWLKYPEKFEEWALANGYQEDLTIDRIDSDKDYCPDNCRWITIIDNSKYKKSTKILEVDGEKHTGREWAEKVELGTNTINTLLREYPKEAVKDLIRARLEDIGFKKKRKSHQTWFDVYDIDPYCVS